MEASSEEAFLPGHEDLPDGVLGALPETEVVTPPLLFVCTFGATLAMRVPLPEFVALVLGGVEARAGDWAPGAGAGGPGAPAFTGGAVVAVNSNLGAACRPGFEGVLKTEGGRPQARLGRPRRVQGNGTCFNSAVEPVVRLEGPGVDPRKIYKLKCFPTTGKTQITGGIRLDLADVRQVLEVFVGFLRAQGVRAPDGEPVWVRESGPTMLNFKFAVRRSSPRVLVNHAALNAVVRRLELARAVEGEAPALLRPPSPPPFPDYDYLGRGEAAPPPPGPAAPEGGIPLPPFPLIETKPHPEDVKVSFHFRVNGRSPRVNVFQSGKINLLGFGSVEAALAVHAFFVRLFTAAWPRLVALRPRPDAAPAGRGPRGAAPRAPPRGRAPARPARPAPFAPIFAPPPAPGAPARPAPARPAPAPARAAPAPAPAAPAPARAAPALVPPARPAPAPARPAPAPARPAPAPAPAPRAAPARPAPAPAPAPAPRAAPARAAPARPAPAPEEDGGDLGWLLALLDE